MPQIVWWLIPAALLAWAAYEVWVHIWLPSMAQVYSARGERDKVRETLEEIVRAPSLIRGGGKPGALFQLAWFAIEAGEPEEAARLCGRVLELPIRPGFASLVRQRLADTLETLGRPAEAEEQRSLASRELSGSRPDSDVRIARARDLAQAGKPVEAMEQYRAALQLIPEWNHRHRAEVLVWLALACYQAGIPEQTVEHAEEAISLNPGPELQMTAHSVAAIGCASLRRLDAAEEHRQKAYDLAVQAGSEDRAGNYLASLAASQKARGHLVEAMQTADRAATMSFKSRRQARLVEADCLWAMGRFDAARTCLEQARKAKPHPQAGEERRSQATLALAQGMVEAEAGEAGAALRWLQEAAPGLRGSPRLCLWHDAAMVHVLALLGREVEARALIAGIEARTSAFSRDPATLERCSFGIGRALLVLGDPAGARTHWLRYLAGPPDPVDRPTGYYFLAECEVALENPEAAYHAYRSGGSLGIETRYARLARQRLKELEADWPGAADRGT